MKYFNPQPWRTTSVKLCSFDSPDYTEWLTDGPARSQRRGHGPERDRSLVILALSGCIVSHHKFLLESPQPLSFGISLVLISISLDNLDINFFWGKKSNVLIVLCLSLKGNSSPSKVGGCLDSWLRRKPAGLSKTLKTPGPSDPKEPDRRIWRDFSCLLRGQSSRTMTHRLELTVLMTLGISCRIFKAVRPLS